MFKLSNLLRCTINHSARSNIVSGTNTVDNVQQCLYRCVVCTGTLPVTVSRPLKASHRTCQTIQCLHTTAEPTQLLNRHHVINSLLTISIRGAVRGKLKKPAKKYARQGESDSELDDSDEDSDDEEEEEELFANDAEAPLVYSEMTINTMRADRVAAKGLKMSTSEVVDNFYVSKFLKNGKVLTKKAQKLKANDKLDLVISQLNGKLSVKRVKVLSMEDTKQAVGSGRVKIRVWRLPFEIEAPPGWKL